MIRLRLSQKLIAYQQHLTIKDGYIELLQKKRKMYGEESIVPAGMEVINVGLRFGLER